MEIFVLESSCTTSSSSMNMFSCLTINLHLPLTYASQVTKYLKFSVKQIKLKRASSVNKKTVHHINFWLPHRITVKQMDKGCIFWIIGKGKSGSKHPSYM